MSSPTRASPTRSVDSDPDGHQDWLNEQFYRLQIGEPDDVGLGHPSDDDDYYPSNPPSSRASSEDGRQDLVPRHMEPIPDELRVPAASQDVLDEIADHDNHFDCPEGTFTVVNMVAGGQYEVGIAHKTTCTCHVGRYEQRHGNPGGTLCEHVAFIVKKLLYDRTLLPPRGAFTTSQLRELFDDLPPEQFARQYNPFCTRQPIEGDCPICRESLSGNDLGEEDSVGQLIWCRASCGYNFHYACMGRHVHYLHEGQVQDDDRNMINCPHCQQPWFWQEIFGVAKIIFKSKTHDGSGRYVREFESLKIEHHASEDYPDPSESDDDIIE